MREKEYTWKYPGDPECKLCKGECYYKEMIGEYRIFVERLRSEESQERPKFPKTNADLFIGATDERNLAEELFKFLNAGYCGKKQCTDEDDCVDCIETWLKKGVEE